MTKITQPSLLDQNGIEIPTWRKIKATGPEIGLSIQVNNTDATTKDMTAGTNKIAL